MENMKKISLGFLKERISYLTGTLANDTATYTSDELLNAHRYSAEIQSELDRIDRSIKALEKLADERLESMLLLTQQNSEMQKQLDEREVDARGTMKAYVLDRDLKKAHLKTILNDFNKDTNYKEIIEKAIVDEEDVPKGILVNVFIDKEGLRSDIDQIIRKHITVTKTNL